jgi:hypothetical protein
MSEFDSTRPEHDPLAEDVDLLTSKEGIARLYDELVATRNLVAELEQSRPEGSELAAARDRAQDLEEALARARKGTSPLR